MGAQYDRKLTDIFALQEQIATEISSKLRVRLTGEEQKRLGKRYTESREAYQLYLKGYYYWTRGTTENVAKALQAYRQAADIDPSYALAYTGLRGRRWSATSESYKVILAPGERLARFTGRRSDKRRYVDAHPA